MDKLEEIARTRQKSQARLVGLKSKVCAAFLEMQKVAYEDGALAKRYKELTAVGISVAIECESCMQWHIEQTAAAGASFEEILEAIEVAIEIGGGPATVSARFALEALDSVIKPSRGY